jgi:pimeloyl-ACP methyl ester carboxylesterase
VANADRRFVLIHGGMHNGSCWERVITAFAALGRTAVAPDLPGHRTRARHDPTFDSYTSTVADLIRPGDVLVGHSMGGAVACAAAAGRPADIAHVICIAGIIPIHGRTMYSATPPLPAADAIDSDEHGFRIKDFTTYRDRYCHDVSEDQSRATYATLERESHRPYRTPISVSAFYSSGIPRSYIACMQDRTGTLATVEDGIKRLGINTVHPLNASHSPFMSRPEDLANLISTIVNQNQP